MIVIRKAELSEAQDVMDFIAENWKKDHILALDREFFCWMYVRNHELNFNVAYDTEKNRIMGINGFTIYNREEHPDIIGSMWKVVHTPNPVLGLELGEYSVKRWNPGIVFGIGMNQRAAKIDTLSGKKVGHLQCWYQLGSYEDFKIAVLNEVPEQRTKRESGRKIRIADINGLKQFIPDSMLRQNRPYKDYEYINHRYFEHPIYKYHMIGIESETSKRGVFVYREVSYGSRMIAKIVDYFGEDEAVPASGGLWEELLQEKKYEFIDFYCYGMKDEFLERAGFVKLTEESGNIIPNYFEPFEQKNVEIRIRVEDVPGFHMYRGDGDQDRPSFLR